MSELWRIEVHEPSIQKFAWSFEDALRVFNLHCKQLPLSAWPRAKVEVINPNGKTIVVRETKEAINGA